MSKQTFKLALTSLVLAGGCSQILGLGDYEIDPNLDDVDPSLGGSGAEGGTGDGGTGGTKGGSDNRGGKPGMGGEPSTGGDGPVAGAPAAGAGGEGGGSTGGEVVPCDSAECCEDAGGIAVGQELLGDGGFELGPPSLEETPWLEVTTTDGLELIQLAGNNWEPHGGDYFTYLSGISEEESYLFSEDVVVPQTAGWLELSGYRHFQIDVEDATNTDYSFIAVLDPDGDNDEELFLWSYGGPDGWGATNGEWVPFSASWDAATHQGGTRYVGISGISDDYWTSANRKASSYLYDDLSLKAYTCMK